MLMLERLSGERGQGGEGLFLWKGCRETRWVSFVHFWAQQVKPVVGVWVSASSQHYTEAHKNLY